MMRVYKSPIVIQCKDDKVRVFCEKCKIDLLNFDPQHDLDILARLTIIRHELTHEDVPENVRTRLELESERLCIYG